MIAAQQLLDYVKAAPFRPFRLHMASGHVFDIRHPEMIKVARNFAMVFTYVGDAPDLLDRWETVSLVLIERVSQLDSAVST